MMLFINSFLSNTFRSLFRPPSGW